MLKTIFLVVIMAGFVFGGNLYMPPIVPRRSCDEPSTVVVIKDESQEKQENIAWIIGGSIVVAAGLIGASLFFRKGGAKSIEDHTDKP